jgi:hypothetical protein
MSLPKISVPTYTLIIPSTGKKIQYRPFLTKEEKILLIALESEDDEQIITSIKNIISSCVNTEINVSDLSIFDIEYIFLNLRARSVGEIIELKITCPDDDTTQVNVKINIDDIKVEKNPKHSSEIKINEDILLKMKYPNIDTLLEDHENVDETIDVIAKCISKIITKDNEYDCNLVSKEELLEFVDTLPVNSFKEIQKFFSSIPKLKHTIKVKNPNTQVVSEVTISGVYNFFG